MSKLKPWAAGPFELIRHAEGHLKAGTDFDKRMALVSFDNAVEVSVTTYLQLHPSQRGGKIYERKKVEEWLTNYHKKLDFLQHFTSAQNVPIAVSLDEIVFYHNLRNELYHAGNGMVPEISCLQGARAAALWTFHLLFGTNAETLLETSSATPLKADPAVYAYGIHTALLYSFIAFEKALKSFLVAIGAINQPVARISTVKAWKIFQKHVAAIPKGFEATVEKSIVLRNALVHGAPIHALPQEINELIRNLDRATEFSSGFHASREFLKELRKKATNSIPMNLVSVRIIQERKRVFLEIATIETTAVLDKKVRRTDLNFIGDYPHYRSLFIADKAADENADIFLREVADKKFCEYFPEMFTTSTRRDSVQAEVDNLRRALTQKEPKT